MYLKDILQYILIFDKKKASEKTELFVFIIHFQQLLFLPYPQQYSYLPLRPLMQWVDQLLDSQMRTPPEYVKEEPEPGEVGSVCPSAPLRPQRCFSSRHRIFVPSLSYQIYSFPSNSQYVFQIQKYQIYYIIYNMYHSPNSKVQRAICWEKALKKNLGESNSTYSRFPPITIIQYFQKKRSVGDIKIKQMVLERSVN